MAAVKFEKGCEEWVILSEFWGLCQSVWEPENTEEYWKFALESTEIYNAKYGNCGLARYLAGALVITLEKKMKSKEVNL